MRRRYTTKAILTGILLAVLASLSDAPAQMTTGTLILALRDSRTGAALRPQSVQIDGVEFGAETDASGLISVRLGGGQHAVRVSASGYDPFEGTVTVDGEDTPVNTFELDRQTSSGISEEDPPLDPHIAVLEGYVVESMVGELIPEATVTIPDTGATALTNREGYFKVTVPVPSAAPDREPVAERIDVKVAREGFVAEERRNVEIISGTTMTVTVQLDRATSDSEPVRIVDEAAPDFRLSSWRYDVTLVD